MASSDLSQRRSTLVSRNERALLELVRQRTLVSRVDLAREMALTVQSVSRLVDGLIERGLLRFGARLSERGSPGAGHGVELEPDGAHALGVSVMTDALSVALVNFRGDLLQSHFEPWQDMRGGPTLERIGAVAGKMLARHVADRSRLLGAGLAVTGFFVEDGHAVNPPPPLDDFALVDLKAMFARKLGLDVIVENDGSAAAMAECLLGVGRRYRSFAYVHVAAGLGGGVIVDGQLMRGAHGNAGEVAAALPLEQQDDRPTLTLLLEMTRAAGGGARSISELLADFDPDGPGVAAWIARVRRPLDMIVNVVGAVLDPDAIVLGGRLPRALAQRLIADIPPPRQTRRGTQWSLPPVLPAETTTEPTAIGAAMLQLKRHYFGD